jgi:tetratricopeptide (TPR) repeat protein
MGWLKAQLQLLTASVGGYATNAKAVHLYECGKDYYTRGERDRAFAYFDEAIRLNPTVADFFCWRG